MRGLLAIVVKVGSKWRFESPYTGTPQNVVINYLLGKFIFLRTDFINNSQFLPTVLPTMNHKGYLLDSPTEALTTQGFSFVRRRFPCKTRQSWLVEQNSREDDISYKHLIKYTAYY